MKDEALRMALEALENHCGNYKLDDAGCDRHEKAVTAINQALAAPVQPEQEPVEEVSVLIDGTAYTVQMPVAGEMLRLHLEILEKQPATVQPNCRHCGGPDNVICAGQCEQAAPPAAQPAQRKPLTDEQQRNGFRDQDSQWTFKGMSAWQVWQKACAWNEAAHGIKENT